MEKEKEKFTPGQKVLVRDKDYEVWTLDFFSHMSHMLTLKNLDHNYESCKAYRCVGGPWEQCIPYRGNEKLLNTSDVPQKEWKPEDGDFLYNKSRDYEAICIIKGKLSPEPLEIYAEISRGR